MCNEVTWAGGAYGSHHLKSPREDQVLGYDTITLDDACVFMYCYGYVEQVTMTQCLTFHTHHQHLSNY